MSVLLTKSTNSSAVNEVVLQQTALAFVVCRRYSTLPFLFQLIFHVPISFMHELYPLIKFIASSESPGNHKINDGSTSDRESNDSNDGRLDTLSSLLFIYLFYYDSANVWSLNC